MKRPSTENAKKGRGLVPGEPTPNGRRWRPVGVAVLLCILSFVAYSPALSGKFVWDDDWWTSRIADLLKDLRGLGVMWTQPTALQQYYPVTGLTFWLDHQAWGDWTLPYHVENVLLHLVSALLFWRLLCRLQVPGAWLAAGLFALHPTMVESVAWITERKNVLSMTLFLTALLAYGKFMGFWARTESPRRWSAYGAALVLFALALLAKISVFALPAVFLLIAWWKTGRIRWKQDILPTLPLFVMSIGFGIYIAWLEKHQVGAEGKDWDLTLAERFLVAGRALWFYVGKLLWPANLCPIYPRWQLDAHSPVQWLWPAGALLALLAAWLLRKRLGRGLLAALLFYAGTLFPVLGFMNAYGMIYTFVSHRWAYISSLGLIALAAAALARITAQRPKLLVGISLVVLPLLCAMSWNAAHVYRGPEDFWAATLAGNPECWVAHYDWGVELSKQGKLDEAIASLTKALALRPNYAEAEGNLGRVLIEANRPAEAMEHLQRFLQLWPDRYLPHFDLGKCLEFSGKFSDAEPHFRRCIELDPDSAKAHGDLGFVLYQQGKIRDAVAEYWKVVELKPDDAEAHTNLAEVLQQTHALREAAEQFEEALKIDPDQLTALKSLAALRSVANDSALRDGAEALRLAQHANELSGGKDPIILRVLAAAYAETGQFPTAAETARQALGLLSADAPLYEVIQANLRRYDFGLPIRE